MAALRPVQWYPGHIAKTEKELKEKLKLMDVVIEVRDARIPLSTTHPQDMISTADRNAWGMYFSSQGTKVVFSNGQLGMGNMKLSRLAKSLAEGVNVKRRAKSLLPRPVRAGIVGWDRFGKDLELLDSPGILPMRISDQAAAIKLAICDDIGERSYDVSDVAAILVQMLAKLPTVGMYLCIMHNGTHSVILFPFCQESTSGMKTFQSRYKLDVDGLSGKIFIDKLALRLFNGDVHQAAIRILSDFRKGKFDWVALERPPR
ncbi:DAR GTPase 3 [Hibiscus syriacus]|uniref:DAR GTPase 3 n=1 Tax=Hibiscus syriacus TaxID=106335 RepID=A0A6A2YQQ1_HIBSY|nr:DAR GTPase 3 [Hibiscus syriacus]